MRQHCVCCAGVTPALIYARQFLESAGITVSNTPSWETGHLLMDVPSFRPGLWTDEQLSTLLSSLPREVTIWGGNLNHPALHEYQTVDFLQHEEYLLKNAIITARCTIPIAESLLKYPWKELPVLIIGWGRISRALASMLKDKGCTITIASGSTHHRAEVKSYGCTPANSSDLKNILPNFRLIINTAPAPVLPEEEGKQCQDCVRIDLASIKGMEGEDVLWARALPGRYAPEASGKLIAETFLRILKEEQS